MIWYLADPRRPKRVLLRLEFHPEQSGHDAGRTSVHHLETDALDASGRLRAALYEDHLLVSGLLLARRRPPPHDRQLTRLRAVLDHVRRERILSVYAAGSEPPSKGPDPSPTDAEAMDRVHTLIVADVLLACAAAGAGSAVETADPRIQPGLGSIIATTRPVPISLGGQAHLSPEMATAMARQRLLEGAVSSLLQTAVEDRALHPFGDELHAQLAPLVEPLRASLRVGDADRDGLARQSYGEVLWRPLARYLRRRIRPRR